MFRLSGASNNTHRRIHLPLLKQLWLAVDEVIHHDDVMLAHHHSAPGQRCRLVIRTRAMRASSNTMPKKDRLPSPGEAGTKLLNSSLPSASKYSISVLAPRFPRLPRPAPIRLVNICEDRAEAAGRCWDGPLVPGYKEQSFSDVAAHWSEQPRRAEGAEDGAVGRIVEEHGQPALGSARWRSLRKAYPRCGELAPRVFRNTLNGVTGAVVVQNVGVAAVPVDLAATACERPWVIAVVGISQSSAERIDRALNRVSGWPGRLEYNRRNKVPAWCPAPVQSGELRK